jgi:serine/threonine protein kinase
VPNGHPERVDAPSAAAGQWRVIGGYRLVDRLSTGVVADVWRAVAELDGEHEHPGAGAVAVKWSGPDPTEEARRRLREEAELLRAVRHPGLVELVELVDDDEEGTAVVTRFVEGATLAERIAEGPLEAVLTSGAYRL